MVLGFGRGTVVNHVLGLVASAAIALGLAWLGFQRDEQKTYG
jgi:hypothetical protein